MHIAAGFGRRGNLGQNGVACVVECIERVQVVRFGDGQHERQKHLASLRVRARVRDALTVFPARRNERKRGIGGFVHDPRVNVGERLGGAVCIYRRAERTRCCHGLPESMHYRPKHAGGCDGLLALREHKVYRRTFEHLLVGVRLLAHHKPDGNRLVVRFGDVA